MKKIKKFFAKIVSIFKRTIRKPQTTEPFVTVPEELSGDEGLVDLARKLNELYDVLPQGIKQMFEPPTLGTA